MPLDGNGDKMREAREKKREVRKKNAGAFRAAVATAGERITHEDIARACGCSHSAITRALIEDGPQSRSPPRNWRHALAGLAYARAHELCDLAEDLEVDADRLERDADAG